MRLRAILPTPDRGPDRLDAPPTGGAFAEAALAKHKQEGLALAVKARWAAMTLIILLLPFINFSFEVLYFQALAVCFVVIGWIQLRFARVGRSNAELLLLLCDLALMTIVLVVPNPLADNAWPLAMEYRSEGFMYFYILLASGTLAYSWRTVRGVGVVTTVLWLLALAAVWTVSDENVALSAATNAAFLPDRELANILNPNHLLYYIRVQEVFVFLVVAITLSISVRRYGRLVMDHAGIERERANLARYFSPNVVEELSQNDEPLKQIRTQDIAVLFVDIVGFTRYAADRNPKEVINTLRAFHKRMEAEVFRHHGTLDKYLGDGLMATFGTPIAGDRDAINALRCARAMIEAITAWNDERALGGAAPIRASFGLHYGPAVLGDIGSDRLEFAVVGNSVNIASRVEALTRGLSVWLAATDALVSQARREAGARDPALADLARHDGVAIRGLDREMTLWTVR